MRKWSKLISSDSRTWSTESCVIEASARDKVTARWRWRIGSSARFAPRFVESLTLSSSNLSLVKCFSTCLRTSVSSSWSPSLVHAADRAADVEYNDQWTLPKTVTTSISGASDLTTTSASSDCTLTVAVLCLCKSISNQTERKLTDFQLHLLATDSEHPPFPMCVEKTSRLCYPRPPTPIDLLVWQHRSALALALLQSHLSRTSSYSRSWTRLRTTDFNFSVSVTFIVIMTIDSGGSACLTVSILCYSNWSSSRNLTRSSVSRVLSSSDSR